MFFHNVLVIEELSASIERIKMRLEQSDSVEEIPFITHLFEHTDFLSALNLHNKLVGALSRHKSCVPVSTEATELVEQVSARMSVTFIL